MPNGITITSLKLLMATDLNKNIVIQITAQTDQLEKSIDDLNKNIDNLVEKQKQLKDAGKE